MFLQHFQDLFTTLWNAFSKHSTEPCCIFMIIAVLRRKKQGARKIMSNKISTKEKVPNLVPLAMIRGTHEKEKLYNELSTYK